MSANLQIIPAYFGPTRHKFDILSHTDDSGKITEYFIPKQFSDFIGLDNVRKNVRKNCPNRKRLRDVRVGTIGTDLGKYNQPDTIIVKENELYKFLLRCRHPRAEIFADWVCDEVLPSIRIRGFYELPNIFPQQPQIEYVVRDKTQEEKMEELRTLSCGCSYVAGNGPASEQCKCPHKEQRREARRNLVAQGNVVKSQPCTQSGKKGGLQTQANIRATKAENCELRIRVAELELLLLNLNLNNE